MKCHYDVLEVSRDADADDIKKAYRKLAMKWHPDKNLENTEAATEQFKIVQQAFEVLSDPHERAWYDDHREAILKGKVGSACDDDCLDVYQYYTASCYQGFGDDEKGFYSIYREVFNKIAAEDSEYQKDGDSDFEVPNFGKSDSSYEEVKNFYNYWQSYCTKRSYAWLDPYDTRQAPNRRVSRLMEKDNKKVRDKARKARNEEVRELVKFVRKRDKRVLAHAQYLQEMSAEKAKKSEEKRLEKIKARKSELASHQESEWSKFSNLENELKDIEANLASEFGDSISSENTDDDNDEEDMIDNLYCVACNKLFKTSKAFENHESSKKHKENIEILKKQMRDSDDAGLEFEISDDAVASDDDEDNNIDDEASDDSDRFTPVEDEVKQQIKAETEQNSSSESEDIDEMSLFCKACGKWFKSIKAINDHKSSQIHIKNTKLYHEIIENLGSDTGTEIDDELRYSSTGSEKDTFLDGLTNDECDFREDLERVMSKFNDLEKVESESLQEDVEKICAELDDIIQKNKKFEAEFSETSQKKKKSKTKSFQQLSESDDDFDFSTAQTKKQRRKQKNKQKVSSKNQQTNLENEPKKTISVKIAEDKCKNSELSSVSLDSSVDDKNDSSFQAESGTDNQDILSTTSTASNKSNKKKLDKNNVVSSSDQSLLCAVCNANFPSKNKLFIHLTKTGHSVPLPNKLSKSQEVEKTKKSKSKKNKK